MWVRPDVEDRRRHARCAWARARARFRPPAPSRVRGRWDRPASRRRARAPQERTWPSPAGAAPGLGPCRILAFLGRRPNYGAGGLPPPHRTPTTGKEEEEEPAAEGEDEDEEGGGGGAGGLLGGRRGGQGEAYYQELAHDLAAIGAPLFLYALSPEPLHLSALQPLTSRSGGILSFYADAERCTMPEDVYKCYL